VSDHLDPAVVHLRRATWRLPQSRARRLAEITPFKQRMGWAFNWVSSHGTDFNHDFQCRSRDEEIAKGKVYYNYSMQEFPSEEAPGLSVFARSRARFITRTRPTVAVSIR
jgi:predicted dithiol-disulfide oxidoreductase (DUF899 family)